MGSTRILWRRSLIHQKFQSLFLYVCTGTIWRLWRLGKVHMDSRPYMCELLSLNTVIISQWLANLKAFKELSSLSWTWTVDLSQSGMSSLGVPAGPCERWLWTKTFQEVRHHARRPQRVPVLQRQGRHFRVGPRAGPAQNRKNDMLCQSHYHRGLCCPARM